MTPTTTTTLEIKTKVREISQRLQSGFHVFWENRAIYGVRFSKDKLQVKPICGSRWKTASVNDKFEYEARKK